MAAASGICIETATLGTDGLPAESSGVVPSRSKTTASPISVDTYSEKYPGILILNVVVSRSEEISVFVASEGVADVIPFHCWE